METAPSGVQIAWDGEVLAHHSLANINRELVKRLARLGYEIHVSDEETDPQESSNFFSEYPSVSTGIKGSEALIIRHRWPPKFDQPKQRVWVQNQPWEFGGIPDSWIKTFKSADELWCCSSWVKDCYVASGYPEEKAFVIPSGVDAVTYSPDGDKFDFKTSRSIKFLFVGGLLPRKGVDLLLKAWTEAFDSKDDVALIIKGFGAENIYPDGLGAMAKEAAARDDIAPIEVIEDDLSVEKMAALYRSCDFLVHPYRGEGFGMPILEAMASGLVGLVTGYGGCRDFVDGESSFLLPATISPLEGNFADFGPCSTAGYFLAEPVYDVLVEYLRWLPEHLDEAKLRAQIGLKRARSLWTWDHLATKVSSRLEHLLSNNQTGLNDNMLVGAK